MIDMASWVEQLKAKLDLGGKQIRFGQHPNTAQCFINFYNLPIRSPEGVVYGNTACENNRLMLSVLFPRPSSHYEKEVKEGTLRVQLMVWHLGDPFGAHPYSDYKLRGKTCSPEKMIDYLAAYLNRVAAEIPSKE